MTDSGENKRVLVCGGVSLVMKVPVFNGKLTHISLLALPALFSSPRIVSHAFRTTGGLHW
jgi:hypothetical protein